MNAFDRSVQDRYNQFPYPPISLLSLPKVSEGQSLSLDSVCETSHRGKRILVAGCGTFEPLIVAQMHPFAKEIVALDFSRKSLQVLKKRIWIAKLAGTRFPKIEFIESDILNFHSEPFDYILASNVLHHHPIPRKLLTHLTGLLASGGYLRVVTYPKMSRVWMRSTGQYLSANGLSAKTPSLRTRALNLLSRLPADHPFRNTFVNHPEVRKRAGLVDAFFHPCENPLSPLEWAECFESSGLRLLREDQDPKSQSAFFYKLFPRLEQLSPFEVLEIMDALLELCVNPVFWLKKESPITKTHHARTPSTETRFQIDEKKYLPMEVREELRAALSHATALLKDVDLDLSIVFQVLKSEVGPRTDRYGNILSNLTLWENCHSHR